MQLLGGEIEVERLAGPIGESARAAGRGGGASLSRRRGQSGRGELGLELLGDPGALIMLMGQVDEEGLDLGTKQRAELVGLEDHVVALGEPVGQALAVVRGVWGWSRSAR